MGDRNSGEPQSYVADRFVDDLFGDKDAFQTMASKDNVLVQVADFFAGLPCCRAVEAFNERRILS